MPQIDWDAVRDEVTTHLCHLIRCNTTNPPGHETVAARYLAEVLEKEGIPAQVLESSPGRGNLVARLRGNGQEEPLLLLSHLDVVPAEADKWTHPPFSGAVVDGYVWGRGAVDTKNLTAIELMTLLLLKRSGRKLRRDVILAATADEEAGGRAGATWLVKHHLDLIKAPYCINEGGGIGLLLNGKRVYLCQTAEKGTARFKVTATGSPGHGSIPRDDNAVVLLAEAVARIGRTSLPGHLTPTMTRFLQELMAVMGLELSPELVLNLASDRANLQEILGDPYLADMLYAMLHNTASPTILDAGTRINVIPSTATAQVDGRILPGQTEESFRQELESILAGLNVTIEFMQSGPALENPVESPLYEAIVAATQANDPGSVVVPFLVTGGTDAKSLAPAGIRVYGFAPMKEDPTDRVFNLAHAHNERISVANLEFGVRVLYDIVDRFCGV